MLGVFGFEVIEAVNGREALDLYQKNTAEIKLVITDIGMPIMDGYELFFELKKLSPGLPIMISSGFGNKAIGSKISPEDIAGIISKPFNLSQLQEALKIVVEGMV
jgi:YesN/AraC family two-component response regulator